jgi:hypothetical protein
MPLRLKSRQQACPNGFLYEQRETGYRNWMVDPNTVWDFNGLVQAIASHRAANKARFPHLNTDPTAIANEVDAVNADRVSKIPGADIYLMEVGGAVNPPTPLPTISQKLVHVAEGLRKVNAGRLTLLEWEQSGEPPVAKEKATARARVCVDCPKNGRGGLTDFFTVPASELIKAQMERSKSLDLSTPHDDSISVCKVCLCPLKLSVHSPIAIKVKHLPADVFNEMPDFCWVKTEAAAEGLRPA